MSTKIRPIVIRRPARIKVKVTKRIPINWNNIQKRAKGSKLSSSDLSILWKNRPTTWAEIDTFIEGRKNFKSAVKYGEDAILFFNTRYIENGLITTDAEYEDYRNKDLDRERIIKFFKNMANGETRELNLMDGDFNYLFYLSPLELIQIFIEDVFIPGEKYAIETPGDKWLTLNDNNISNLWGKIEDILSKPTDTVSDSFGEIASSMAYLTSITIHKFTPYGSGKGEREETNSGFFPYFNTDTTIDLDKQQIFRRGQPEIELLLNDNCFIYALKESKLFSSKELDSIKIFCKTRDLSGKKIGEIARKYDFSIAKRRRDKYKNPELKIINPGSKRKVCIGQLENHFFFNETITNDTYPNGREIFFIIEQMLKDGKFEPMNITERIDSTREYQKNYESEIKELTMRAPNINKIIMDVIETGKTNVNSINIDFRRTRSFLDLRLTQFFNMYGPDGPPAIMFKEHETRSEARRIKNEYKKEIWCADFEAYNSKTDNMKHKSKQLPILLVAEKLGSNSSIYFGKPDGGTRIVEFKPNSESIKRWFAQIKSSKSIIYFHNLAYDICQLLLILPEEVKIIEFIPAGSSVIKLKILYDGKRIEFRCSFKLTTMSIAKLAKSYLPDLKIKKEMCPYGLYNDDTINLDKIPIGMVKDYFNENDYEIFSESAKEYIIDDHFFLHKYNEFYCSRDVEILSKSLLKFQQMISEELELNCFDYITAPSLADAFFTLRKCYEEVYEFSGIPLLFMRRAVVGGRCMTRNNKSQVIKNAKILDMDNNSLYPAAMSRIAGFPMGIPDIIGEITEEEMNKILDNDNQYFIIEIDITDIKEKLDFPLISRKNEEGIRIFSNDIRGKIVIDKYALQDAIKYQNISFKVIRGYLWHQMNNTINSVIKEVYQKRLTYKAQKNAKQEIFKLLMNSAYGKTIMKAIDKDHLIVDEVKVDKIVSNNFQNITSLVKIGNSGRWLINSLKKTNEHFTRVHCGCAILSMSKRIMNEPMCLAEKMGFNIYYQDTDSMHIKEEDYRELEKEFEQVYGRKLSGGNLGEFSSDYEENMIGVEGYYLAKKLYAVKISNGEKDEYHLRAKGLPQTLMEYNDYDKLYNGQTVSKNLLEATPGIRTTGLQAVLIKDFIRNIKI